MTAVRLQRYKRCNIIKISLINTGNQNTPHWLLPELCKTKGSLGSCPRILRVSFFQLFPGFSVVLDPGGRLGGLGGKVGSVIRNFSLRTIFFFSYACHEPQLVSHETASSSAECSRDKPPFSSVRGQDSTM